MGAPSSLHCPAGAHSQATPADSRGARRSRCADVCKPWVPSTNTELPGEAVLVVGCDSMLEIDGQMLGKPHTPT